MRLSEKKKGTPMNYRGCIYRSGKKNPLPDKIKQHLPITSEGGREIANEDPHTGKTRIVRAEGVVGERLASYRKTLHRGLGDISSFQRRHFRKKHFEQKKETRTVSASRLTCELLWCAWDPL